MSKELAMAKDATLSKEMMKIVRMRLMGLRMRSPPKVETVKPKMAPSRFSKGGRQPRERTPFRDELENHTKSQSETPSPSAADPRKAKRFSRGDQKRRSRCSSADCDRLSRAWEGEVVVSLLVPQVANWGEPVAESLTPDSDIDSGVFSQESGPTRLDTSDVESDEEQRKEKEENEAEERREGDGDEEDDCLQARPKTPFTRRIWNRQNGWYRVRKPGSWSASTANQGRDLRAELEVMRREIAEMLDDTRELDERDNSDSRDCSETSEEEEEEQHRDNGDVSGEEEDTEDEEEEEEGDRELFYDFESSDENDSEVEEEVEEEGKFQSVAASY